MRRDFWLLLVILAVALAVRVYPPWQAVFGGTYVDFLETDAWYHIRLIENQVRNWPWRVTLDPYAAPGGQFVPIAPFFDAITATAVRVAYGADATTGEIQQLAAFMPPVLGVMAIVALWALAAAAFDRVAALVAAALLAILPGHFLDRTQLGFYDHHALEALLAITTLWGLVVALQPASTRRAPLLAGVSLGLYLLGWSSGAFLLGILGAWLVVLLLVARSPDELVRAGRAAALAALVALLLVLLMQDRRMFRYESQVLGLLGLAAIGAVMYVFARRLNVTLATRTAAYVAIALIAATMAGLLWMFSTGLLAQVFSDVARLGADPRRMGVLEARPLFLYTGVWDWTQPWVFFRIGFYVGLVALGVLALRIVRDRHPVDLLIWVTTAAMFVATYGQNRFGYYLVPMCALVCGWLASWLVSVSRRPELATLAIAALFSFSVAPTALTATRAGSLPAHWNDALMWLREHTPAPFVVTAGSGDEYYYAHYPPVAPPPDYSVMNWWDHGYWLVQIARRVPVANPTQERAASAARFYAATDEAGALATLARERARYVISDWELPFRYTDRRAIMGRFQNVIEWAGASHAGYYEVMYQRGVGGWNPLWVFHEPYYRSMAFRLSVLGGAAAVPTRDSTAVIAVAERVDSSGLRFKEVLSQQHYASYEAAVAAARVPPSGGTHTLVVGLDPWRAAFPVERLTHFRELYAARTPGQAVTESPWVRVFEIARQPFDADASSSIFRRSRLADWTDWKDETFTKLTTCRVGPVH